MYKYLTWKIVLGFICGVIIFKFNFRILHHNRFFIWVCWIFENQYWKHDHIRWSKQIEILLIFKALIGWPLYSWARGIFISYHLDMIIATVANGIKSTIRHDFDNFGHIFAIHLKVDHIQTFSTSHQTINSHAGISGQQGHPIVDAIIGDTNIHLVMLEVIRDASGESGSEQQITTIRIGQCKRVQNSILDLLKLFVKIQLGPFVFHQHRLGNQIDFVN